MMSAAAGADFGFVTATMNLRKWCLLGKYAVDLKQTVVSSKAKELHVQNSQKQCYRRD